MAFWVLIGTFAAFGVMSALWAALGWLLPGLKGCAVVFVGRPGEGLRRRYRWLRGLGLVDCPLIVTEAAEEMNDIDICSREELLERLTWEADRFGRTGT